MTGPIGNSRGPGVNVLIGNEAVAHSRFLGAYSVIGRQGKVVSHHSTRRGEYVDKRTG